MLNKGQLKEILQVCDNAGIPDSVEMKIRLLVGDKISLDDVHFIIDGQDSSFSIDVTGHWAAEVSESNAIVLKQI